MIELGGEAKQKSKPKNSSEKSQDAQAKKLTMTLPTATELTALISYRIQLKRQIQGFRGTHQFCGFNGCRDCELALGSQSYGGSSMQSFEEISGVLRGVRSIAGSGRPSQTEVQYHIALDQGNGVLLRSMIEGDIITVYGFNAHSILAISQQLKPGFSSSLGLFAEQPKLK